MIRPPPTIDVLPDGSFRSPPQVRLGFPVKLAIGAALVALLGTAFTVAALAIWVVSMILPVVIIAGGVAWAALRYRRWQSLRGHGQLRPHEPRGFGQ